MTLDYIQVRSADSIAKTIKHLRVHERRTGKIPVIVVMDDDKVRGHLPAHVFGIATLDEKVEKYMKKFTQLPTMRPKKKSLKNLDNIRTVNLPL